MFAAPPRVHRHAITAKCDMCLEHALAAAPRAPSCLPPTHRRRAAAIDHSPTCTRPSAVTAAVCPDSLLPPAATLTMCRSKPTKPRGEHSRPRPSWPKRLPRLRVEYVTTRRVAASMEMQCAEEHDDSDSSLVTLPAELLPSDNPWAKFQNCTKLSLFSSYSYYSIPGRARATRASRE